MKTKQGKSRGGGSTWDRRTAVAASRKRLRRLRPPSEDEEEEEDELEWPAPVASTTRSSSRDENATAGTSKNETVLIFPDLEASSTDAEFSVNAVCERNLDEHPLHSDELDQLQFELERALVRATVRKQNLQTALQQLSSATCFVSIDSDERKVSTSFGKASSPESSAAKRKYPKGQQAPLKRATTNVSPPAKRSRPTGAKDQRRFFESAPACSRYYFYAHHNHQIPDKFWGFIDQYAGPLESDTLELLRTLVTDSDTRLADSKAYYEIPESNKSKRRLSMASTNSASSRGPGHDRDAAKAPLQNNSKSKKQGGKQDAFPADTADSRDGSRVAAAVTSSGASRKGRTRAASGRDNGSTDSNGFSLGPLTERLVQALMEECSNGQAELDKPASAATGSACANSKALMKTLNLGNLKALENKIRKELLDQGLLESESDQGEKSGEEWRQELQCVGLGELEEDDDEVTAELKRRQHELIRLQRSNYQRLGNLLVKAETQAELHRCEEDLRNANEEVLNLCSRYYGVAPTSRKPSGKKERDALWKALKERDKAVSALRNRL